MTDRRKEFEQEAFRIIDTWRDIENPVAALAQLKKSAGPDMSGFFAQMQSELAMVMHEPEDPAP